MGQCCWTFVVMSWTVCHPTYPLSFIIPPSFITFLRSFFFSINYILNIKKNIILFVNNGVDQRNVSLCMQCPHRKTLSGKAYTNLSNGFDIIFWHIICFTNTQALTSKGVYENYIVIKMHFKKLCNEWQSWGAIRKRTVVFWE